MDRVEKQQAVRVMIRVRPMLANETTDESCVCASSVSTVSIVNPRNASETLNYT